MSGSAALRERLDRGQRRAVAVGGLGLAVCVASALVQPSSFYPAYLVAFLFWVGIGLGCVALTMLHHLVGGGWGLLIRRPLEAGALTLLPLAALFVPLALGLKVLYPWADPSAVAADPTLRHKAAYLSVNPFLLRAALDFVLWIVFALLLNRWSLAQDRATDDAPTRRLRTLSGPGLALVFLTASFAALDWGMSIEPDWYSTIYGAMVVTGWGLSTFAVMILVAGPLATAESVADGPALFQDLGNLMLAFVMLWAYMSFSQFLIIWCGNLTEEVPWYLRRTRGGWQWVALALVVFHFFAPFFLLLFRDVKRNARVLPGVALLVVVMHWINMAWLVLPAFAGPAPRIDWVEVALGLAATAGIGGVVATVFLWRLKQVPPVPLRDPGINPALEHQGGNAP